MEDLRCSGVLSVKEMIRSGIMSKESIDNFADFLLQDLMKMKKHQVLYTDLLFVNIFVQ